MTEDQVLPGEVAGAEAAGTTAAVGPFVQRCATRRHKYLFDVNTSRIVRVSPTIWEIVEDVGVLSKTDAVAKYSRSHRASEVAEAYDAVLAAQSEGLLSASRPRQIVMPYGQGYIEEKLASSRMSVTLAVTEQCNFRCSYCVYGGTYSHQRTHSSRLMPWAIAERAIDEFLGHSAQSEIRSIHFYGGEPLLNLALLRQCVHHVFSERRQTDIEFVLTTNGYLLQGDAAEFVAGNNIRLNVSLDGPEQVHDRYRRLADGSGTWRRVTDNIRSFLDRYPQYRQNGRLGFHSVLVPPVDLRVLQGYFGSSDLFGPGMRLSVSLVSSRDTTFIDSIPPQLRTMAGYDELYDAFVQNMRDGTLGASPNQPRLWVQRGLFEKNVQVFYQRGYATPQHPRIPDRFCSVPMCVPGARRLFVNADGSYYPCERVQEALPFCIGNVRQGVDAGRVRELLEGYVELCKQECRSCWCLPICMAGCVVVAIKDGKPDGALRKRACERYRTAALRTMSDVCEVLEHNPQALRYMDGLRFV